MTGEEEVEKNQYLKCLKCHPNFLKLIRNNFRDKISKYFPRVQVIHSHYDFNHIICKPKYSMRVNFQT